MLLVRRPVLRGGLHLALRLGRSLVVAVRGLAPGRPGIKEARVRGRALHVLDPDQLLLADERAAAGDRDHVPVDLRDRVVDVVHVRLLDPDEDLLALLEGQCAVLDLVPRALVGDREGVERAALGAVEVEDLPGLLLELAKRLAAASDQDRRHPGVDLDHGAGLLDRMEER